MQALEFIIDWLPIPLQLWILVLLWRKNLAKRFPWFLSYTVYVILVDVIRDLLVESSSYFYVYWATEGLAALAAVLAIHESFKAIFGEFYRLTWFRLIWPATIVLIWIYCTWRAWTHPPPHFSRSGAMLISAATWSSFTIVGLVLLFFLLAKLITKRWYIYEFHIVYGLGVASAGMVIAMVVSWEFGTRFRVLSAWASPVTYLAAVFIWLSAFLRTEPQILLDVPPEKLLQQMQEDLNIVQRIHKAFTAGKK